MRSSARSSLSEGSLLRTATRPVFVFTPGLPVKAAEGHEILTADVCLYAVGSGCFLVFLFFFLSNRRREKGGGRGGGGKSGTCAAL